MVETRERGGDGWDVGAESRRRRSPGDGHKRGTTVEGEYGRASPYRPEESHRSPVERGATTGVLATTESDHITTDVMWHSGPL